MPTIAQAQAAFFSQGGFKGGTDKGKVYYVKTGKGQAKADFSKAYGGLGIVQALVAQYISEFLTAAAENLKKTESVTTGKLVESLDFDLETTSTGYVINFTALDYYRFVDLGVRGSGASRKNSSSPYKYTDKMPPIAPIRKWIKDNRLTARATDVKRYGAIDRETKAIDQNKANKSLAYLIARSIKNEGLKATNFWTDALEETFADFGQNLSKALGVNVSINIQQMAEQFKKGKGVKIPK